MSQFFISGGQSIGASASVLQLTGLISLLSKGLSGVFSNITVQKHQFFSAQLSLWSNSHNMTTGKTKALTRWNFVGKVMSLLFNMPSRLVIAFPLRSKQASFNFMVAITICSDFGAQKCKVPHCFHWFPICLPWIDRTGCHHFFFFFECWVLSQLFHSTLSFSWRGSSLPLCFLP